MKRSIYILFIIALLIGACEDKWDSHYSAQSGGDGDIAGVNIWEHIKNIPDYSSFVKLMEETGVYKELEKDQIMTLWVVPNEYLGDLSGKSEEEKKNIARHHINYLAVTSSKMKDQKIIKTMADKNVTLHSSEEGFTFNGFDIQNANQLCTNGVVHEIAGTLLPVDNIYEYLMKLGNEYSIFRDSLFSKTDTIFLAEESFPIGVTETGNTIYDSVFLYKNPYFEKADITQENKMFTLFLPSNNQFSDMFQRLNNVFGENVTSEDSIKIFNWFMYAAFHNEKVDNYGDVESLYSAYDNWWKTDKQLVAGDPVSLSNGYIYNVSHLHIPNYILQKEVITYATYYNDLSDEDKATYYTFTGLQPGESGFNSKYTWSGKDYFMMDPSGDLKEGDDLSIKWTAHTKDRFGKLKPALILPGKYTVSFAWRPYLNGTQATYVNDIFISEFYVGGKAGKDGVFYEMGEVEIPESAGLDTFTVKSKWVKDQVGRIAIYAVKLTPDPNNY